MATVVLQYVGQAVGTFLGGPIGGAIGRAAGAIAGNWIDQSLFGATRRIDGPRIDDLRVMAASEGAPMPRLWGRMRVSGQVIWATNFEEVVSTRTDNGSAKGGGGSQTKVTEYDYFANFAVALCEGEIDRIGRVWADGKEFDISELTYRLYTGTADQEPDSLILAKEGPGNAPAYRDTAYVVFERMPVSQFGNRLPQLSFEAIRSAGGAEERVRAINIIPGSTEFGYDTSVQVRRLGQGVTEAENGHASAIRSDWTVSIDELTATCRNLEAASLVVAWFGDDLRCGETRIRPGVEAAEKDTAPDEWRVAGLTRAEAHLVSASGGGPAYGGTPSDDSVVRAIADLRERGLATCFYPFILMDIPAGNGLVDPYGGSEQAAHPWRGRITCHPAPGQTGSIDKTAACAAQVAQIVGVAAPSDFAIGAGAVVYSGPAEWSLRRMVLHYAHLCALAGGVDTFLIGSELRGLTRLRGPADAFPFVAALAALAADVRAILPAAEVSYAADWSEYFGYHPADGSGDVFFNLDPLWASPDVAFVGIDNYMPLSDWRDGHRHADFLAGTRSIYDRAYLAAGIAGGEGHDWYYGDAAARLDQIRSPIADGAYGKPWVFRYKDLKSWWSNPHVDRPGGSEAATATAWVPQSKPIRFTEAGCPAIDKGANQPNVFLDTKSSESFAPYYSGGQRDDLMQNRYVSALGDHWAAPGAHNPVSPLYGGPMVDRRIFWWAWDARPFPYFPVRTDVWADGGNFSRGHWLNGRAGAVPLDRLIVEVCAAYGFAAVEVSDVEGLVDGFVIDRGMTARDALQALLSAFAVDAVESDGLLAFRMRRGFAADAIDWRDFVEDDAAAPLFALTRSQETELPAVVRLSYVESALDYRRAAVEARHGEGASLREINAELPCAVAQAVAQSRADIGLAESRAGRDAIDVSLPPGRIALEPGDVLSLTLPAGARLFRIEEVTDGAARNVRARSHQPAAYEPAAAPERQGSAALAPIYGAPDAILLDLPIATETAAAHAPWIAASARPWPGRLALHRHVGATSYALNRTLDAQATKGVLTEPLSAGPLYVFDRGATLTVKLDYGGLASVDLGEVLRGRNVAAVGDADSGWEILQFAAAELVAPSTYRLSVLLRGQSGSEPEMPASRPAGSRFVLLNGAVVQPALSPAEAGLMQDWKIGPAQFDLSRHHLTIAHQGRMLGLRPLSPCQLRARREAGDMLFSWIRRTRIDGDSWDLAEVPLGEAAEAYRVEVMDGAAVVRAAAVAEAAWRYPAADIAADFGAPPAAFTLRIAQSSASFGRGANLLETVHA